MDVWQVCTVVGVALTTINLVILGAYFRSKRKDGASFTSFVLAGNVLILFYVLIRLFGGGAALAWAIIITVILVSLPFL